MSNLSICILGFFNPEDSNFAGIYLPTNLTRINDKGKSTEKLCLVIDNTTTSMLCPVYYTICHSTSLETVIKELKEKEETKYKNIGYFNIVNNRYRCRVKEILEPIKEFCHKNYFDVAVWSDIPPNFTFNQYNNHETQLLKYVKSKHKILRNTQEYIKKLPACVYKDNSLLEKIVLTPSL